MAVERKKIERLAPLYRVARRPLPGLAITQPNVLNFASRACFYTSHDLRNLKQEQSGLCLLCYVWLRYRQLSDNLVNAVMWHMKQMEDRCKEEAKKIFEAGLLQI